MIFLGSTRLPTARCASSGVARRVWLLRWLLVLLLAWDQIGSPLHRHHHESAFGAHALTAHAGVAHVPNAVNADDADSDLDFAHAVMAVRPQFECRLVAAAFVAAESGHSPVAVQSLAARATASLADPRPLLRPDKVPPAYISHRSLPPAGRAPPLHA